ncbi:MAG: hypothetical protein HQK54_12500, partial [Oligoflexales bacterium]|nr:hypothetical protein [Oligoflexales bacterium]
VKFQDILFDFAEVSALTIRSSRPDQSHLDGYYFFSFREKLYSSNRIIRVPLRLVHGSSLT